MEKMPFCIVAKCEKTPLQEIETESTWTMKRFFCPKCGRAYGKTTGIGKATQVATLVTASVMAINFVCDIVGGFGISGLEDVAIEDVEV